MTLMPFKKCDCLYCAIFLLYFTSSIICESCLTGGFVNIQSWVLENGSLNFNYLDPKYSLDCSNNTDALAELRLLMTRYEMTNSSFSKNSQLYNNNKTEISSDNKNLTDFLNLDINNIVFLSLARNNLHRIPLFYTTSDGTIGSNWKNLKYLSLYGNNFSGNNSKAISLTTEHTVSLNVTFYEEINPRYYFILSNEQSNWAKDLTTLKFPKLLELDLRKCSIQILFNSTFKSMPKLMRLYLAENQIYQINSMAFMGLSKLVHLDISGNNVRTNYENGLTDGMIIQIGAFKPLTNLTSLDFSKSKIAQTCATVFSDLYDTVERISLCHTKFPYITKDIFKGNNIKYLDISGNPSLSEMNDDALDGMKNSLEVLYANGSSLKSMVPFQNLHQLKVLSLPDNDIVELNSSYFENLNNLRILDLSYNRIKSWESETFYYMESLEMLLLDRNNLNLLTTDIFKDVNKVKFLNIGTNNFVCNCLAKELYNGVLKNENDTFEPDWFSNDGVFNGTYMSNPHEDDFYENLSRDVHYQRAYVHYSDLITSRRLINNDFLRMDIDVDDEEFRENLGFAQNFTFKLLDWNPKHYRCVDIYNNTLKYFSEETLCEHAFNKEEHVPGLNRAAIIVIVLIVLGLLSICIMIVIWKWWHIRYFFMMLRDSAILSNMDTSNDEDSEKVFFYDVFVSYCDEDREWILNEFLPQIDCNPVIKACLHERDFQVGLTIFENIITCMDHSRALLMVVSNRFISSQWCQFEMHLAQHRLLETRREQLILVLLEDIPRRKRPNTLHYLMMTKTYIVWPKKESERPAFWKRLKRAILSGKYVDKSSSV